MQLILENWTCIQVKLIIPKLSLKELRQKLLLSCGWGPNFPKLDSSFGNKIEAATD